MTKEWRGRSRGQGVERSLSWLQQSLDLYSRSMPKPQAELHLKINSMMEQMVLVNSDSVKSWAKGGSSTLQFVYSSPSICTLLYHIPVLSFEQCYP